MILVINAGSSSIKFKLFEFNTLKVLYEGIIQEIKNHHEGFEELEDILRERDIDFSPSFRE